MAIVYQGDAGLNAGISQAGGALAQALGQVMQQRKMQSQFKSINEKIKDKPLNATLLQQILAEPGGMQYLQQFGPIIAPVLKEQARSQGVSQSLSSAFPDIFGGPAQVSGAAQTAAPQTTPIQEANALQKPVEEAPKITPTQEVQSVQGTVPGISGVPSTSPVADSNRSGPQEQTIYQQGGQAGMGINPPQEAGGQVQAQMAAAAQAQPNATPKNAAPPANLGELTKYLQNASPEERSRVAQVLAGSPYQELRDYAKVLSDQAKAQKKEDAVREERSFQLNKPLYEGINKARRSLPEKSIALERIDDAIQSGEINRFTDWAADRLGLDPLKTTQSQILDSAVKELFLADLQTIQGGRLNQLIEGNLLKAFQNIGKSPEANQEITETLYAIEDITKERIKIFDRLSDQYEKAGRELPRNAQKKIEEDLNPYIKDRLSELTKVRQELKQGKIRSNRSVQMRRAQRQVQEQPAPQGSQWVLAPNGQIKAVPLNRLKQALSQEAGGRLINE